MVDTVGEGIPGPIGAWDLSVSRQDDGSLYLQITHAGGGIGLLLTDEERRAIAKVVSDSEGASFYRALRKDRP